MKHQTIELCFAQCRAALTALGGWLGYFLGGTDGLLTALIVLSGLDYLTGCCAPYWKKSCPARWDSEASAGKRSFSCWWASGMCWTRGWRAAARPCVRR